MKILNRKVFMTIYIILSLFILFILVIYNINIYKNEYNNVSRNLTFMEDKKDDNKPEPKNFDDSISNPKDNSIDNMMIMDYEVYTVELSDKEIVKIINHSNNSSDFNIYGVAQNIINKNKGVHIGNLYSNGYSYNYKQDSIVIINTKDINNRLLFNLIVSLLILVVMEVIIYFASKLIAHRIVKPAQISFDKQKDFIADASHELKTPLSIIMASADELKITKQNKKYVDNIKYESERMNNLIKNLLDLSKLENNVSINNYKEENISRIIEIICSTFEGIAFEKNIIIDTNIDQNIHFRCSKEEIERLISIILDNAVKHGDENSKIVVSLKSIKNNIYIDITNSGKPIKKEDEEKIFERFYRADKSRNRDANRYGLGLAIAKSIVINHGGIIKASSKCGKTTFSIILKK